jgi:hypothetical protein
LKFLKTIEQAYKKAPNYSVIADLVQGVINCQHTSISEIATKSIQDVATYLGLHTEIINTSSHYGNDNLSGQDRVLDICIKEGADYYVNSIGGKDLYSKETFRKHGIQLDFIKPKDIKYKQFENEFIPWLSIIDVLMFNDIESTRGILEQYSFV